MSNQHTMIPADTAGDHTKWWGASMTIWGAGLTALSTVLPLLGSIVGLDLSPEIIEKTEEQIVNIIQVIGGMIGTAMTIYGRIRATTRLIRREMRVDV
ncbi:MAG: hypothetical protein AAFR90_00425 [Pseudomonadota bacterium]